MPRGTEDYEYFLGMFSSSDQHDLEPGQASMQINCWSPRNGELVTRNGLQVMDWYNGGVGRWPPLLL